MLSAGSSAISERSRASTWCSRQLSENEKVGLSHFTEETKTQEVKLLAQGCRARKRAELISVTELVFQP